MSQRSTHLGDGVYLSHDGYQHWLAANHHLNTVIALEPVVALTLCKKLLKDLFGDGLSDFLREYADKEAN